MTAPDEGPASAPPRGPFARLRAAGEEPDPRFTLANERTYLAWARTGLSLVAAAVGLEAVAPPGFPAGVRTTMSLLLAVAGGAVAASALRRWWRVELALRTSRPLPYPPALVVVGAVVVLAAAAVAVLVLVG